MSTKEIVREAYVQLAADVLDAYWRKLEGLAAGRSIPGLMDFKTLYNAKVTKLREKGRLGPKAWAALEAAMPNEARTYFRQFAGGFDMTTDAGFLAFLGAIDDAARGLDVTTRQNILDRFVRYVSATFNQAEDDQDDSEDED